MIQVVDGDVADLGWEHYRESQTDGTGDVAGLGQKYYRVNDGSESGTGLVQSCLVAMSSLAMDYITWSSMNVNRDTVNDFSLIGRFEIFESNIHDTRLMHEQ